MAKSAIVIDSFIDEGQDITYRPCLDKDDNLLIPCSYYSEMNGNIAYYMRIERQLILDMIKGDSC